MPQTTNFGFPLWADTPPEGATGKDLRDAVLGESTGSLSNMADKAIAKVKNSVPPVDLENINFTWNGVTTGLTAASGSLSNGHKNSFAYYKILDTPVSSKIEFLASGKIKYDGLLEMEQSGVWSILPCKESEFLYSYQSPINTFGYVCFSVFKAGTAFKSGSNTLTFPEIGFYVTKALGNDTFRAENIKTAPTVYDPDTMPDAAVEVTSHKVVSIDENSTDTQYPSAKAVWEAIGSADSGNCITGVKVNGTSLSPTDGEVNITVPTKTSELNNNSGFLTSNSSAVTSKEDSSNKATYIDDSLDANINNTNYPTNKAVYDFVSSYTSKQIGSAEATIFLPLAEWDGNTTGKFSILSMFYKVSENTEAPEQIKFDMSFKLGDGTVQSYDFLTGIRSDTAVTDFKESLGITIYQFGEEIGGVIAERAGTLPAALIEQITGINPGADIPFEAGTYVMGTQSGDDFIFVSKAESCISVKDYIDNKDNISGTWTPQIYRHYSSLVVKITSGVEAVGTFTKIGDTVTVSFSIKWLSSSTQLEGMYFTIAGVPYAPDRIWSGGGTLEGYHVFSSDPNMAFSGWKLGTDSRIYPMGVSLKGTSGDVASCYLRPGAGDMIMSGSITYLTGGRA